MLGASEFRLRQGFAAQNACTALIAPPHLRRGPGRRYGFHERNRGEYYTSICSMMKASMISPSLMSWNFSKVMPHS